jgi:hypothetical protein
MAVPAGSACLIAGARLMWSGEECATPEIVTVGKAGDLLASFDFSGRLGQHSYPCVSRAQQAKFQEDFREQFESVQAQLSSYKDRDNSEWLSPDAPLPPRLTTGPYRPRTDFRIFVSETYPRSKALVPAWLGQRGWMEFPAHRVVAGEAAIAHELAHVLFPNGNRMLAEGLAVYLQYKLFPTIPVYPNFGDRLETLVAGFLRKNYKDNPHRALWDMNLDALEKISTPDKLSLRIGRDAVIGAKPGDPNPSPDEVKTTYAVAGSLVEFLLENLIGDDLLTEENFGTLYKSTPLRPLERDSGNPERWRACYQADGISYSFTELGLLWKTYMHFILFSNSVAGGKAEIPIPRQYAEIPLVAKLYKKLNDMTGLRSVPGGTRAKAKARATTGRHRREHRVSGPRELANRLGKKTPPPTAKTGKSVYIA